MEPNALQFLETILNTPSPSGYEQKIQQVVRDYAKDFATEIKTDVHGNVIACVNPDAKLRIMIAGHCDQIGMLVTNIHPDGFIYAQTIGGWDPQQLVGQRMTIWSESGPVAAVISRKPIHLLEPEERKRVVKIEDLWLDIGASSRAEVEEIIRIGDAVTLKPGYQPMMNNCANAPGMDDRAGVWVVMEALRRCSGNHLNCAVYGVSTVQEEIGLRGATTSTYSVNPHVGIAVDVTHATDCPTIDQRQQGEISLGKGPVLFRGPNANPRLITRLAKAAEQKDIPFQYSAIGRATSNDANQIQINRGGVAAAIVGIPNRYMHSAVETISLDDIDRAADLLAEFVTSIEPDADFTP